MRLWKCSVCGYLHKGDTPPDVCSVCSAKKQFFVEADPPKESSKKQKPKPSPQQPALKSWQCLVCGHVYEAADCPQSCSVCGAAGDRLAGLDELEKKLISTSPYKRLFERCKAGYRSLTVWLAENHAHPISVHLPNGVLPIAVLFVFLSAIFDSKMLGIAGYLNLIISLLSMPAVIYSGYNDWKLRYGGRMTKIFKIKIRCAVLLFSLLLIMVIWWSLAPRLLLNIHPIKYVFLSLNLVAFGIAAVAGYYGGKLVKFKKIEK